VTRRVARSLRRRLRRFEEWDDFVPYGQSARFADLLADWLDDLERDLLTTDPRKAIELLELFIRADDAIVGCVDDSDGEVGAVFRRACAAWARAAARSPESVDRVDRLYDLHATNEYGVRDGLLDEAGVALGESDLRRLAARYEDDLKTSLSPQSEPRTMRDHSYIVAAAALGQVACVLEDAELYERSVRLHSPEPNDLQSEGIAEVHLRFGRAEKALEWLGRTGRPDPRMLATAYEALGDESGLREARKQVFGQSLEHEDLESYLKVLPEPARTAGRRDAIEEAMASDRVAEAILLLLKLEERERATTLALDKRPALDKTFYGRLREAAESACSMGAVTVAVLCYRALTNQILAEGRSKAYGYAASYCCKLERLDDETERESALIHHAEYIAALRERHGRKWSFWKRLDESPTRAPS